MIKRRILALAVAALCGLASVSASATTTLEFTVIDLRDLMDDPLMNSAGSYSEATHPGGPSFGLVSGTLILEFQGDGAQIQDGAVSLVGGSILSQATSGIVGLIEVSVDIVSTFEDGSNDGIGTLSGWDGSSGTITWTPVMRSWPDDIWPGEGIQDTDPNFPDGPTTARLDTLGVAVVNDGTLGCTFSICGNLGTPPDGIEREYVDYDAGWADPFPTVTVTFANGFAAPFAISFPKFIIGYDPITPTNKAQEMIFETEGQTVPEPGAGAATAAALAALVFLQRRRAHRA